jgi:ribosomal protein S19E (S16A)
MTDRLAIWTLMTETMQAIGPFYREAMTEGIQASGVPDFWFGLYLAQGTDPQPFTVQRYQDMFPYTSRERQRENLEQLRKAEYLEQVGEDAYVLTDAGRKVVEGTFQAAQEAMEDVVHLPMAEAEQLNDLLWRIVEYALSGPMPETKWALLTSRRCDPGEDATGIVKTDQYLTDLVMYRDDAHIAASKNYGVNGRTWETLTFVWNEEARTAEALAERLGFRGFTAEDYAKSLSRLEELGWIEPVEKGFQVTDEGRALRDQAEDNTNLIHFECWDILTEKEIGLMADLLTRAKDNLVAMAEAREGNEATE